MLRSLRENPRMVRVINEWLVIAWLSMIPVVLLTRWYESLPFLTAISLWANIASHWATAVASRADENSQKESDD